VSILADSVDHVARTPSAEAHDRALFEEEALGHADQLYRIALRLSGSTQTAEELVQETYLRALRAWRSYRPGTNLAAWLATILRNAYLDEARRRSRRPATEPLDDESEYFLYDQLSGGRLEGPQEALMSKLTNDAILQSLEEVPEHFREAVVLVDIGDFSYQEAADILDVPIGTVMSRLHRGRRQLKRALASHAIDGGEDPKRA
jgi:RNA polymerase sigma-70 factor (ECF subfamily)